MRPDLLATKPAIDVPGDAYYEIPPRPRVKHNVTGEIDNIDNEIVTAYPDRYTIIPGPGGQMWERGTLMGFSKDEAVWRFGTMSGSRIAEVFGVSITEDDDNHGFLWVLATRGGQTVKETFRGWATHMPAHFQTVIDAPVLLRCLQGHMQSPEFFTYSTHHVARNGGGKKGEGTRMYGPSFRD